MFSYSKHFLQQIENRNLTRKEVEDVLTSPVTPIEEDGLKVYQGIIEANGKRYLLRIFVNMTVLPPLVVTAYKTSKINKYLI